MLFLLVLCKNNRNVCYSPEEIKDALPSLPKSVQ